MYVVTNSAEVIGCYYTYLLNTMDADSVSHLMHCNHLITGDDYEAITAAPNDSKMNSVILEYARAMDWSTLFKFTDLLISIETQQSIGEAMKKGMYICMLSKNTLGVKKFKANHKQHYKQAGVTKSFDIS